jgi:hypothetical protein
MKPQLYPQVIGLVLIAVETVTMNLKQVGYVQIVKTLKVSFQFQQLITNYILKEQVKKDLK